MLNADPLSNINIFGVVMNRMENQIQEFLGVLDSTQTSINHMLVFSIICQNQPITSADLSERIGMKKSTLNRLLHSLSSNSRGKVKAAELIEIEMMQDDRRHRSISLTPKGVSLMNKMFGGKK